MPETVFLFMIRKQTEKDDKLLFVTTISFVLRIQLLIVIVSIYSRL